MAKPQLRAVRADEAPPAAARPLSLLEAIAGGDRLQILLAQRREIAACLPDEKGPAKAALHRQLTLISTEIESIQVKRDREAAEDDDSQPASDEAWDEEAL